MSQYDFTFYGYDTGALVFDTATGAVRLSDSFDLSQDRIKFEVNDNDSHLDGDEKRDEIGEDADQQGRATRADGTEIEAGNIYSEEYFVLEAPDGSQIRVDVLEIDGAFVGYLPSAPLSADVTYEEVERRDADNLLGGRNGDDTRTTYADAQNNGAVCFGPGTMITTEDGNLPVEWLETGDKVLTRDHGFQPVLWVGRTKIPPKHFYQYPNERPVRIPAGALGPDCPTHDLCLTGDHRIMIRSAMAELMYFSAEVLAPAKAWVDADIAKFINPQRAYLVTHVLFASHQVIVAQGAWVESMFTGPEALRRMKAQDLARLENLLGDDLHCQQTARPCLTRREAAFLLSDGRLPQENAELLRA
ncbi:MAG: Hint domain-containing protein [Roseobacter sp.]